MQRPGVALISAEGRCRTLAPCRVVLYCGPAAKARGRVTRKGEGEEYTWTVEGEVKLERKRKTKTCE